MSDVGVGNEDRPKLALAVLADESQPPSGGTLGSAANPRRGPLAGFTIRSIAWGQAFEWLAAVEDDVGVAWPRLRWLVMFGEWCNGRSAGVKGSSDPRLDPIIEVLRRNISDYCGSLEAFTTYLSRDSKDRNELDELMILRVLRWGGGQVDETEVDSVITRLSSFLAAPGEPVDAVQLRELLLRKPTAD
ncbi:MAG: hypothetical protein H6722_24585 [Sandaracinus sp.]|nr:hypothetical protein [Sandaracinus sp.]